MQLLMDMITACEVVVVAAVLTVILVLGVLAYDEYRRIR